MKLTEISDILSKSKIIELILAINEGNTNYSSIRDYIIRNFSSVSSSTISRQLDYLYKIGLVDRKPIENRLNEFTHHPTGRLHQFAEAIKSLQFINNANKNATEGKIHKLRGGDRTIKIEINLPEEIRGEYKDNQILNTVVYHEIGELLIKIKK